MDRRLDVRYAHHTYEMRWYTPRNQPADIKGLFPLRIDTYRKAALEDLVPRLEEIDAQYQVSETSAALSVGNHSLFHALY